MESKPEIAKRRSCKGNSLVGGKLGSRGSLQPTTSHWTICSIHLNISIVVAISIIRPSNLQTEPDHTHVTLLKTRISTVREGVAELSCARTRRLQTVDRATWPTWATSCIPSEMRILTLDSYAIAMVPSDIGIFLCLRQ